MRRPKQTEGARDGLLAGAARSRYEKHVPARSLLTRNTPLAVRPVT
jgi:hypothetical protein